MADVFERVTALRRDGRAFALATVVARQAPVSAHLGDRAIVLADGTMEGFVGGACAREIVRAQALDALRTRRARLVSIRPDARPSDASDTEHVVVPMTCVSEGAVDVYVEPFLPARRLVVVGATPVASALARVAGSAGYEVVRLVEARERGDVEAQSTSPGVSVADLDALDAVVRSGGDDVAVVVASQGHYDEAALDAVLPCEVPFVGLVASRQRGAMVRSLLEPRHGARVSSIRNPVGLDLGARTPAEVALSILAEIVQTLPSRSEGYLPGPRHLDAAPEADHATASRPTAPTPDAPAAETGGAIDPVCGMTVDVATSRHTAEVSGTLYHFCCARCRARFVEAPQQYLAGQP